MKRKKVTLRRSKAKPQAVVRILPTAVKLRGRPRATPLHVEAPPRKRGRPRKVVKELVRKVVRELAPPPKQRRKITVRMHDQIVDDWNFGDKNQTDIARRYKISQSTVSRIVRGL